MRHLALAIAAVLSLALVAPAFAQPFADVPADHWAFDAIAELAAKGILEGFPDGTFKGDRAMTRYEMAMALARILARIEAIKIPPPPPPVKIPPPEVRRADIDRLTRLINEFRAELSALGVRITAVEEELAALKARLDNTKVTGDVRFRYNVFPTGTPSVGGTATNRAPDARLRARLTFTGQVTPDVRAVVRLFVANNTGLAGTYDVRFGNTGVFNSVAFDQLYLDVATSFGLPISWRIGRQPVTLGGTFLDAVGVGLLFDEANYGGLTGVNDGVRITTSLGPLSLFAFALQENVTS
ncbi:MAG: S-layer homology domain-containing protein, partial [Armatimonadota bacterium]|nr:S-layer homology domain-containing protein [Armatimonadota bacterium]